MIDPPPVIAERSNDAPQERDGAVPLLGLEPANVENTGLNPVPSEDSNLPPLLAPLLGTMVFQVIERQRKCRKSAGTGFWR